MECRCEPSAVQQHAVMVCVQQDELNAIYEEMHEKKGAPQAQKGVKRGAKEESRDDRRRQFAEELKNSAQGEFTVLMSVVVEYESGRQ